MKTSYTGKMRSAYPDRYALLKDFARNNRKNMTFAEGVLWEELRKNRTGVKFYRQHIIAYYIVDFLCADCRLVIEVDGGYHSEPRQAEDDRLRTEHLKSLGYHVIRFTNEDVLYNTKEITGNIKDAINQLKENEGQ